jgi:hypothetical protein
MSLRIDLLLQDEKGLPKTRSFETLRREFQLSDSFDFVKAGVEAIIEDQVTSRFEAEELKVSPFLFFTQQLRFLRGSLIESART